MEPVETETTATTPPPRPGSVAIAGLGLLGASLGMALRGSGVRRVAWARRPETRNEALRGNIADECRETLGDLLADAELAIFCVPIPDTIELIRRHAGAWPPGTVISDVGSVKAAVVEACVPCAAAHRGIFVGSHPMAGREKSGTAAALPDLFRDAKVFITPHPTNPGHAVAKVENFWRLLSCRTLRIDAETHDRVVARSSHLAHLAAYATVLSVLGHQDRRIRELNAFGCAGGFRDTTRIASSEPSMWRHIFQYNKDEVLLAAKELCATLDELRTLISTNRFDLLEARLAEARALRQAWLDSQELDTAPAPTSGAAPSGDGGQ